jgi:hypothetical protein
VPNPGVDMSSWPRSACYPRRTFYPLSDGPSIRDRRITKPDFRLCSTCSSRSQAGLCLCTLQVISKHLEPTLGSLRYALGGDRPSQTTRLVVSPARIHGRRLDTGHVKGGISPSTPPSPEAQLHRLPPILRMTSPASLPSYSKGARGLSV